MVAPETDLDLVAREAALSFLTEQNSVKAKLVELRLFYGLTDEQAAVVLGISTSAADRPRVYTWNWLRRELGFGDES